MKKNLLAICAGLLVASVAFTAQADVQLTYKEKYGDHMGASQGCQAKDYYFYDAQGQVVRHVFQALNSVGDFEVQNVEYYTFDDNGNLTTIEDYQYRPAYDDWKLRNKTNFQYDAAGNLIEKSSTSGNTYQYTYDANGNVVKCKVLVSGTDYVLEDITYSDFVEGAVNKPRSYSSQGAYNMYTYSGTIEYDDQFRVIADDRLTVTGSKMQRMEYVYDAKGVCVSEKWYTSTSYTPETIEPGSVADTLFFSREVTRTLKANKYYQVVERANEVVDFDENFNNIYAWTTYPTTYNEYYAAIDETTAPTGLTLRNVSTAAEPNSVKVTAQAPDMDGVKYIIWRNWDAVATVDAVNGVIEYVDKNVESREHTYFVQAYDPNNEIYYNVTPLTSINMLVDLAPVTDIKLVAGRKGSVKDPQTGITYDTYFITIEWAAPVSDYAVKQYQVYQQPFAMPIATVSGDVLTAELDMPDSNTANIRVDAIYELGTAVGEYVTFTWDSSKDFEGEQEKPSLSLVKVYNGGETTVNLYNAENQISRTKTMMALGTGGYGPDYQYYYNYVDGMLDEYYYIQYKDMGVWTDAKDHTYYEYDEQGRLVRSENVYTYNDMYEYTYDEQGRLVSYTRFGKTDRSNPDATYDKKYHTVTYSDFDANGNPLRKDYTDHLYATGSYFTFYTYDAQGNVLVEESWKPDLNSSDVNAKIPYLKYEYTYDENGIVLESLKSGKDWDTGEFVYESRETRTQVSDLQYHFATYNYVASNDSWSERATKEEYYAMLDGAYAPLNISLTYVDNVNFVNAVQLSCSVPATEVPNAQYIIWQDWQPVDTVAPFNGRISYVAQNLENGRDIEFVVQSYDAVNDVVYNASDVVAANFTIELPPVTNLHYVKTTEGTFQDGQGGTHPAYWVHFAWDAPDTDLEIKHYNIYETGWAVPAKTTVNTCDSLSVYREKDFDSVDQQKQIGVQVSVEYVVGESEVVTQTFDIEHTGLVNVNVADAYVDGSMLYANAVADVVIYNVAGVAVINRNEVTTLELDALPTGAYVAAVKMEGKLQVIKFVR